MGCGVQRRGAIARDAKRRGRVLACSGMNANWKRWKDERVAKTLPGNRNSRRKPE